MHNFPPPFQIDQYSTAACCPAEHLRIWCRSDARYGFEFIACLACGVCCVLRLFAYVSVVVCLCEFLRMCARAYQLITCVVCVCVCVCVCVWDVGKLGRVFKWLAATVHAAPWTGFRAKEDFLCRGCLQSSDAFVAASGAASHEL